MVNRKKQQWSKISIATNGKIFSVRYSEMDIITLTDLLYAMLKEVPHAPQIMQLVLEKYKKDHEV